MFGVQDIMIFGYFLIILAIFYTKSPKIRELLWCQSSKKWAVGDPNNVLRGSYYRFFCFSQQHPRPFTRPAPFTSFMPSRPWGSNRCPICPNRQDGMWCKWRYNVPDWNCRRAESNKVNDQIKESGGPDAIRELLKIKYRKGINNYSVALKRNQVAISDYDPLPFSEG